MSLAVLASFEEELERRFFWTTSAPLRDALSIARGRISIGAAVEDVFALLVCIAQADGERFALPFANRVRAALNAEILARLQLQPAPTPEPTPAAAPPPTPRPFRPRVVRWEGRLVTSKWLARRKRLDNAAAA